MTVTKAGNGEGLVTSSPSGIVCGQDCDEAFMGGTVVTLTAKPSSGSRFGGWSGAGCSGTGSCQITMNANRAVTATFTLSSSASPSLTNLSTRGRVETGDNQMIGGFVITGSEPREVLIRARGPSMPVSGTLANPNLRLFSGQTVIASNNDWQNAANATNIQATGKAPPHSREAAILTTLNPGPYTAIVNGVNGGTGIGIVEVFDIGG